MTTYIIGEYVSAVIEDLERNCIWIGTINYKEQNHLVKLDLETEKLTKHYTDIPSSFTSTLYLDKHNSIWIGTWGNGLYRSDKNITEFTKMNLVST